MFECLGAPLGDIYWETETMHGYVGMVGDYPIGNNARYWRGGEIEMMYRLGKGDRVRHRSEIGMPRREG